MEIKKVKLTKDNLCKIKEVDDTFYKSDNLNLDWYLERYEDKDGTVLLLDEDKCVGYIVSVPIRKELYDAITNGVIVNDVQVSPKMFINNSLYYYVVSCVVLNDYKSHGYGSKMLEMILCEKKRYCALTVSDGGYHLAKKYMDFKMNVYENINVFIKNNG